MQASSRYALLVALLCAVALLVYWVARPTHLTDTQQIDAQIHAAAIGANQHSVGAIMSVVSPDYNDSGNLTSTGLRVALARAFRDAQSVTLTDTPPVVTVSGNTATSDNSFTVQISGSGGDDIHLTRSLHLTWARERGYRYLVIPTPVWRVVKADYGGDPFDAD